MHRWLDGVPMWCYIVSQHTFSELFDEKPIIYSDNRLLETWALDHGYGFEPLTPEVEHEFTSPVLFMPYAEENVPTSGQLRQAFKNVPTLMSALMAFSSSEEVGPYVIERMASLPYSECVRQIHDYVSRFEQATNGLLVESGEGHRLEVSLPDDLPFMTPKLDVQIKAGEVVALAQYIELGLVPLAGGRKPDFRFDGSLVCEGVSVAHHLTRFPTARPIARGAWSFLTDSRVKPPLTVHFSEAHIVSIMDAFERELLPEVVEFVESEVSNHVIELAFSTLPEPFEVDWSFNAAINEAAGGMHVGLGMGLDAAHIDFVALGATVRF